MMKYSIKRMMAMAFLMLLPSYAALSQTAAEKADKIRKDGSYIFGEGYGSTFSKADQDALANLVSKISVTITSSVSIEEVEMTKQNDIDSKSVYQAVMNTYSQGTLSNTESIVLGLDPNSHVMRYIKKSEISKIFDLRKELVFDYVRTAQKCEKQAKIDDALRYYYWAFTLLKSLQYPNEVTYEDKEGKHILASWITLQLNEIFSNLHVKVAGKDETEMQLYITYKDEEVRSVDFTYFDGLQWSSFYSAKDGVAVIDLRSGVKLSTLQMKWEYEYRGESHINREVEAVMNLYKSTSFPKATVVVGQAKGTSTKVDNKAKVSFAKAVANGAAASNIKVLDSPEEYLSVMSPIVEALRNRNYISIMEYFTKDGWDMFDRLIHYGNAKLIGEPTLSFYPLRDGVVCRSVPMSFSFEGNKRKFIENVTFTFNTEKKIDCVAFSLGSEAQTDIFNKSVGYWPEESKMILATFLENYKTAFALKRIDYIEDIFDDNAVIITGHVVKKQPKHREGNQPYLQNDKEREAVKYTRHSKQQYIRSLRESFRSKEFINIKFTDNDISRMGADGEELYGIQIHQDYYSPNYGDTGYLFLYLDITDPDKPSIKVRTWQPNRDPNINNRLPKDDPYYGLYGPGNF